MAQTAHRTALQETARAAARTAGVFSLSLCCRPFGSAAADFQIRGVNQGC